MFGIKEIQILKLNKFRIDFKTMEILAKPSFSIMPNASKSAVRTEEEVEKMVLSS